MDKKERLQRQAVLRRFIAAIGDSNPPIEILDVGEGDMKLTRVLKRHYDNEWRSFSDDLTAFREVQRWLSTIDCDVICWVTDAGAFRNPSIWFAAGLEQLLAASHANLLLSTPDDEHGVALLQGEHDVGVKSW